MPHTEVRGTIFKRAMIAALLAFGALTLLATSQPRWTLDTAAKTTLDEGEETAAWTLTLKGETLQQADLLRLEIRPGEGAAEAVGKGDWSATIEGMEAAEQPLKLPQSQTPGPRSAEWRDRKVCPPSGPCTLKLTVKRSGEALPAAAFEAVVLVEGRGDHRDPTLNLTPAP